MRKRLSQEQRRSEILKHATELFLRKGFAETEMEDIRLACGISRGGLYHHFANKTAVLAGIIEQETQGVLQELIGSDADPIHALLQAGSGHLGNDAGILKALKSDDDRLTYLAHLENAQSQILRPALQEEMKDAVRAGVNSAHVVELFLTVNALINRRVIMGEWSMAESAAFSAMALETLAPLMLDAEAIRNVAQAIRTGDVD